jgi:hypothetical protein
MRWPALRLPAALLISPGIAAANFIGSPDEPAAADDAALWGIRRQPILLGSLTVSFVAHGFVPALVSWRRAFGSSVRLPDPAAGS